MPTQHIQSRLQNKKLQAIQHYLRERRPLKFFRAHTHALNQALRDLWLHHFGANSDLSLLAVGGFGRGEMYPHSDLDLAIVAPEPLNASQQNQIAQFVQNLWDWQLKPAVRSGSLNELLESARHDLSTDTAFLEAQHLSGSPQFAESCLKSFAEQRNTVAFMEGKLLEMQQRHAKQLSFALEPNIKNTAGGLRDIHTMMWLAKVQNLSGDLYHVHKQNLLNRVELGLLRHSHRTLARIRIELHLHAGREEDRLIFDLQSVLAKSLDLSDDAQLGCEKLMHQTYRALKIVRQLNDMIVPMLCGRVYSHFPRHIADLDEHYYAVGNKIAAKDLKLFEKQPEHLFILIEKLQQNRQLNGIAPKTLREWWTASQQINADFYQNPENRARFLQFFQWGDGLTHIMRLLNIYGILGRYIPEWQKIVGLLQHDLFHIYPVDDHILMVLQNMRRFAIDAHSHELPFASGLMHEFEPKYVLYLAAMFHDIAKGRNGRHEILGVADAQRFAQDHNLPTEDANLLAWLVEQHLLMSQVAQKQDIDHPQVIADFCQQVRSPKHLTALYLLTVADIRGTNPKIWNGWKAQLLERLFQAALKHLSGENTSTHSLANVREQQAHDVLLQHHASPKQIKTLWQILGQAYFVSHSFEMIAWHLPFLFAAPDDAVAQIMPLPDNVLRILVYMPNGDRLFTRLCRLLSQHGLDIVAARAFITEHNYILDTFHVSFDEHILPEECPHIQAALLRELRVFIEKPFEIASSCSLKSRRAKHLPLTPILDIQPDHEKQGWYSIEIIAANRNALLADITEVFAQHQVRLRHAHISTLGDRVEDRFWVHAPQWQQDSLQQWAFQRDLLAQLA